MKYDTYEFTQNEKPRNNVGFVISDLEDIGFDMYDDILSFFEG